MELDNERELIHKLDLINRRLGKCFAVVLAVIAARAIDSLATAVRDQWTLNSTLSWIVAAAVVVPITIGFWRYLND